MKFNRKLKKKIITIFGRGTYFGIIQGYLTINKFSKNFGVKIIYTNKLLNKHYMAGQYNPFLNLKIY